VQERASPCRHPLLYEGVVIVRKPVGVVESLLGRVHVLDAANENVLGELVLERDRGPLLELDHQR
jgi:hypothetical protein